MKLIFVILLLALTIGAKKSSQQRYPKQSPPQGLLDHPQPQQQPRWKYWLSRLVVWVLGLATIGQTVVAFWGPFWPTLPDILPGPPDLSNPFDVPFTINNRSIAFDLEDVQISCWLKYVMVDGKLMISDVATLGMPTTTIRTSDSFTCYFPFSLPGQITDASIHLVVIMNRWPWEKRRPYDEWEFSWDAKAKPPRWIPGHDIGHPPQP